MEATTSCKPLEKPIVLVIESEPVVRMEAVQMLSGAGYAVFAVPNTDDAITLLEDHDGIRAVFTEIRVPGRLDGMNLARAIAERWPQIRLVVTSSVPKTASFPDDWRYVPKPYDGAQIAATLCSLLTPRLKLIG